MTTHSQTGQSNLSNIATEEFVTNDFGDTYLYSLSGDTFNRFGADTAFLETFADDIFRENYLYFFIGSDSGLLPAYIERKGIPKGSRYIFIEPSQILDKISSKGIEWDKKITFSTPENAIQTAEKQGSLGALYYAISSKLVTFSSLACHNEANSFYIEIKADISDQLNTYWRAAHTVHTAADGKLHVQAAFINSVDTIRNATFLKELAPFTAGKTAVILAGGPSLDLFIDWVKENKKHVLLIAVSRVTEKLHKNGITPDIVVACDPQNVSLVIGKGLFLDYTPLFAVTNATAPDLVGQWPGKMATVGTKLPYPSKINCYDNINPCPPTVTHIATNIAAEMGVAQIVLLGADFCYSEKGDTHASGSGIGAVEAPLTVKSDIVEVTTYEGRIAQTDQELLEAKNYLEKQAKEYIKKGIKLVNPAPNSAAVPNIEFHPLKSIIIQPLTCSIIAEIERLYPEVNKAKYLHELKNELIELNGRIDSIKQLATTGIETIDAHCDSEGGQYRQLLALIKGMKNRISSDTISFLLNIYGKFELAEISTCLESGESSRNITLESHRMFFCTYLNICDEIQEIIADSLQRLESRLEETKSNPDIPALVAQWYKDKQPGRAHVLKTQNPDLVNNISTKDKQLLNELEAEFLRTLPHIKEEDQQGIDSALSLDSSIDKINLYYNTHNINRLIYLNNTIEKIPDKNSALYCLLIQGIIHELNLDYDKALYCFSKITNADLTPVISLALEHTVTINMNNNDHQSAILAMEKLAQISCQYQPHLAQMLDSIGHTKDALETLEKHLLIKPQNIPTLIKVAYLRFETNDISGAKQACHKALELNPDLNQIHLLLSKIDVLLGKNTTSSEQPNNHAQVTHAINQQDKIINRRWPAVWKQLLACNNGSEPMVTGDTPEPTQIFNGIHISSAFDSLKEAQCQASVIPDDATTAWVYGAGSGKLIETLITRKTLSKVNVVIMNQLLFYQSLNIYPHHWLDDHKVHLTIGNNLHDLKHPFACIPPSVRLADQTAWRLRDQIQAELTNRVQCLEHASMQKKHDIPNIQMNVDYAKSDPDVATLFDSLPGSTINVIAGGPTSIDSFARLQKNKGYIIAVSTALTPLLEANITPDLTIAIDSQPELVGHLPNNLSQCTKSALVYTPAINREMISRWPGPRYVFYHDFPFFDEIRRIAPKASLYTSGTVTHDAVDLAVKMGATRINLIGCDFGYPGNLSHAIGSRYATEIKTSPVESTNIENGYGKPIQSMQSLIFCLRALEEYIAFNPSVTFINCSRKGAKITGCLYSDDS